MTETADKLLIVNADDLGRTSGINAGVFEAHRRGIVTSATLMVAYEAAAEAAVECAAYPDLGIGLHVALTGGPPLLPPERLPSLVDDEGRLPRGPEGLSGADPTEVRAEVRAQFERFLELTGRLPTHLDGHHHSHRVPVALDAVIELAVEHGLPVRDAGEGIGPRLARAGVVTIDRFDSRFYAEEVRLDALLEILDALVPGANEVMCHPGRVDEELRAGSTYTDDREREIELLSHPEVLRAARRPGVRLANYSALGIGR